MLGPDIPCGIVINPVLSIDKACITLFREIPNEDMILIIYIYLVTLAGIYQVIRTVLIYVSIIIVLINVIMI